MRRIAANLLLLSLVAGPATIAWPQSESGFPPTCSQPHPSYVCVRMWNQLSDATVAFFIDQTAQGSAGPGQSVYGTAPSGTHHVGATVVSDPTGRQRQTGRTVVWAPGANATYCIFEPAKGGC